MRRLFSAAIALSLLSGCVTQTTIKGSDKPVFQNQFDPVEAAKTRIALGLNYLKNGDTSQAKFNLERAMKYAPDFADAHNSMAYYYQVVKEPGLAQQSYLRAIEIDKNNPDTLNNYGAFLCKLGEYDQAVHYLYQAIAIPSYIRVAETYDNLGVCALEHDKFDDAMGYLQSSLSHNPYRATTLLNLAALHYAKSEYLESKKYLDRLEKNARFSSRGVMLRYKVEKKLGNLESAKSFGGILVKMFPESYEAKSFLEKDFGRSEFEKLKKQYNKFKLAKFMATSQSQVGKPGERQPILKPKIKRKKKSSSSASRQVEAKRSASSVNVKSPTVVEENQVAAAEAHNTKSMNSAVNTAEKSTIYNKDNIDSSESNNIVEEVAPQVETSNITQSVSPAQSNQSLQSTQVTQTAQSAVKSAPEETNVLAEADNESVKPMQENVLEDSVMAQTSEPSTEVAIESDNEMGISPEEFETLSNDEVISRLKAQQKEIPFHKVVAGDSLYNISMLYNIRMDKLMDWNDLDESKPLFKDSKVYLQNPKVYHSIVKGDTLFELSLRYKVALNTLLKWNKLSREARLQLGQKIIIVNPSKF